MIEFKGTKGKWRVVDTYGQYIPDEPQIVVWNGDEMAFKPICDMGEIGDMNYAEDLANAKLIASSPELLNALQSAIKFIKLSVPFEKQPKGIEKWDKLINKALF